MILACAMTGTTGGGEWTALAFLGVPLLGLLIGSRLLRLRSSGVPPSAPPARAQLPDFPLATVPKLGTDRASDEEERLDELIGV
jgi:hypothetical protein